MGPKKPGGHDVLIDGLWRAAQNERLPHALLFTGSDGIGKHMAAGWFLAGLFCEVGPGEPCGSCGACKRLAAESFGDLCSIDPEAEGTEKIQVGRIVRRKESLGTPLEEFLSLKPAEGGWRGVIIRDVERANRETQNALLKTLEEPGDRCCIVLVSSQPGRLLETVRSRCVQVGFESPDLVVCAEVLIRAGFAEEIARQVSRWVSCAPGRALRLARREGTLERQLLEEILMGRVDALEVTPRIFALEGDLGEGSPSALSRRRAAGFIELGVDVVRDIARMGSGVPAAETPHGDLPDELVKLERSTGCARKGLEPLWRARSELDSNLAPEAVLDRALSELQTAFGAVNAPRLRRG